MAMSNWINEPALAAQSGAVSHRSPCPLLFLLCAALLSACSNPSSETANNITGNVSNGAGAGMAAAEDNAAAPSTAATDAAEPPAQAAEEAQIDGITTRRLSFDRGASTARLESSISGREVVDYLLNVRAGQSMNISLASSNTATYFNLLEPGEAEVAIFNGSMSENMFEGVSQKSGDYRIRVYLYRNAARRGEKANYNLEVAVN